MIFGRQLDRLSSYRAIFAQRNARWLALEIAACEAEQLRA